MTPDQSTAYVCKYLRANENGVLSIPVDKRTPEFHPATDAAISAAECFDLLRRNCAQDDAPNWRLFRFYTGVMEQLFAGFESYSDWLFMAGISINSAEIKTVKQPFFNLLLSASRDCSITVHWLQTRNRVRALDLIAQDLTFTDAIFSPGVKSALRSQGMQEMFKKDWRAMTTEEGVRIVQHEADMTSVQAAIPADLVASVPARSDDYAINLDKTLKMLAIERRWKSRLAGILQGMFSQFDHAMNSAVPFLNRVFIYFSFVLTQAR